MCTTSCSLLSCESMFTSRHFHVSLEPDQPTRLNAGGWRHSSWLFRFQLEFVRPLSPNAGEWCPMSSRSSSKRNIRSLISASNCAITSSRKLDIPKLFSYLVNVDRKNRSFRSIDQHLNHYPKPR